MSNIHIKKSGDWAKAMNFFRKGVDSSIVDTMKEQLMESAELVKEEFPNHIDAQDLDWSPLSPSTIAKKGHDKVYLETGELHDAFKVEVMNDNNRRFRLFIGVKNDDIHKASGLSYARLLSYLEYGTDRIPPRPFIEPVWEEVEPVLRDLVSDAFESAIKKG